MVIDLYGANPVAKALGLSPRNVNKPWYNYNKVNMTPGFHKHMSHVLINHVFAVISLREKELDALLYLSSYCHVAVSVLCLVITVPCVGLQCLIGAIGLL